MAAALRDYKQAIDKNPDNADNYFNRGNVHLTKKEFDEAHKDFDTAIAKEELNAKFYHAKGLAFQREVEAMENVKDKDLELQEAKTNKAIAQYAAALQYCDTFISPMFHQGLMFHRQKRYHDALKMFTKVEELLPGDTSVYIERGLVYQDMGNHNAAIDDF